MIDYVFVGIAMIPIGLFAIMFALWLWGFAGHVGDEIADAWQRAMDRWHL